MHQSKITGFFTKGNNESSVTESLTVVSQIISEISDSSVFKKQHEDGIHILNRTKKCLQYPWIDIKDIMKAVRLFCKVCRNENKDNVMGSVGTANVPISAI